jgi:hypothetical protein
MALKIEAKFHPGKLAATPAAIKKIDPDYAVAALTQHLQGKWGTVDRHDWQVNEDALKHGGRVMSVYPLPNDPSDFWIITEGEGKDKITTFLLPSDY